MVKHKSEKFLFAVSDVNNGNETSLLSDNKLDITPAVMYRTVKQRFHSRGGFRLRYARVLQPAGYRVAS